MRRRRWVHSRSVTLRIATGTENGVNPEGSISVCKNAIGRTYHEAGNDAMKLAFLESEALSVQSEVFKVRRSLRDCGSEEREDHAAGWLAADADVKENLVSHLGPRLRQG